MKKRKDGLYAKYITITLPDGTKKRRVVYGRTQAEVKRKAIILIDEHKQGITNRDKITVAEYSNQWIRILEGKRAKNTVVSYQYAIKHINDAIGKMQVNTVVRSDIQSVINNFDNRPREAQVIRLAAKRIFDSAIDDGYIAKNPTRGLVLPRYEAKKKRFLSRKEQDYIEAAIEQLPAEPALFLALLYYTGARRGEVLGLKWTDVDKDYTSITIRRSVAFDANDSYLKAPKTVYGNRPIPIPPEVGLRLKLNPDSPYAPFRSEYELIFNRNGQPLSLSAFRRLWTKIENTVNDLSGGELRITPHMLRHNYASMLYAQGVDVKTAQVIMGHSNISVTMDIYTHLAGISKVNEARIRAAWLDRGIADDLKRRMIAEGLQ